jgi:hypothetical protein
MWVSLSCALLRDIASSLAFCCLHWNVQDLSGSDTNLMFPTYSQVYSFISSTDILVLQFLYIDCVEGLLLLVCNNFWEL